MDSFCSSLNIAIGIPTTAGPIFRELSTKANAITDDNLKKLGFVVGAMVAKKAAGAKATLASHVTCSRS